jgi:hypothetical protein
MTKANTIICEIDGPQNQSVMFRPWGKKIRGRFDIHRLRDAGAGSLMTLFPQPIPGQYISLDLSTAEGIVIEPLHEDKFAAIRERIEKMGQTLPAQREVLQGIDLTTCLWWLRELVNSGKAKLIEGEFPKIDESKVQRRFHSTERPGTEDKLLTAIERQNDLLAELIGRLAKQE